MALEEVDALTPETPPIAPPRPPARQIMGSWCDGAYVVWVNERDFTVTMSDGRTVSREWFEDNVTSWARV